MIKNYIAALLARIYIHQEDYDQAYSISMLAKYDREDPKFILERGKELDSLLEEVLPHIQEKKTK